MDAIYCRDIEEYSCTIGHCCCLPGLWPGHHHVLEHPDRARSIDERARSRKAHGRRSSLDVLVFVIRE